VSVMVLMFRGNVVRAVLAGIPVLAAYLLISSNMAPLVTTLALKTPSFAAHGAGELTAFIDGGIPVRFWVFHLFQGHLWAFLAIVPAALAMYWTRQRSVRLAR
jgi:galactitol PTS system EIIC component